MEQFWRWLTRRVRRIARSAVTAADGPVRRPLGPASAPFIDLVDRTDLTFDLLNNSMTWRERAVHEIVLRDSDHVDVTSAYQVRLPMDMIQRCAPTAKPGDQVRLLLPFTIRSKQLLLNVNFAGVKGETCALVPRARISTLQAAYLESLDSDSLGSSSLLFDLWEGVSSYTVSTWRSHRVENKPGEWRRLLPGFNILWRTRTLLSYLGTTLDLEIEQAQVVQWLDDLVRRLCGAASGFVRLRVSMDRVRLYQGSDL